MPPLLNVLKDRSNSISVLTALLKALNIPVSFHTIKRNLEEHPDFPSLLSLSDCLYGWEVPHQIYQIEKKHYNPEDISFPFIAHMVGEEEKFILITEIEAGKVRYKDEHKFDAVMNEGDFLVKWDGVILYAQKESNSGEEKYWDNLVKGWIKILRIPFLILVLALIVFLCLDRNGLSWIQSSLLGLNLIGVFVTLLLLTHSIDSRNPFIQNLCTLGNKNGCNNILLSEAANVTSWLSWSEVGFCFFTGSSILLLNKDVETLHLLGWLNVASLPYTVYSFTYQYRVKNWCVLCCTVQVILWLETAVFFFTGSLGVVGNISPFSILCFLAPVAIWSFIKPFLIDAAQISSLKLQVKKFKYNSSLFYQLLGSQLHFQIPDSLKPVQLGNPLAKNTITIVSSPYCGPCATAHRMVEEWLTYREDIKLNIIFASSDDIEDPSTQVAVHINALNSLSGESLLKQAVEEWYAQKDKNYEEWARGFPVEINQESKEIAELHNEWCMEAKIGATPTILIDGYKLPAPYRLEDIIYLFN
ncbi:Protein-disulfide isomerase [Pedobacter steynii]|uniref:Protein-disulfide isomerase n=1 Tax=Pedobacter steynii TaxID=430522 RepID=A0A1G9K6P6_9SPHI|nr:cysteine peptidase family C39 domain-containing protein [Pedobacter steynii]NQX38469.1 thioredoxin domain-containing protein [Pedobacter steynii]SDL45560.1 Protein-disulfide isomerase [Pedobacter steynii]